MQLPHVTHPVWILLRLTISMLSLYFILLEFASEFDKTERMTLIGMFIVLGGGEGVNAFIGRRQSGRSDNQ